MQDWLQTTALFQGTWYWYKQSIWIILPPLHFVKFPLTPAPWVRTTASSSAALFQHRGQHLSAERLYVFCSARSLFSPPIAKDGGDCRRSKPSSFVLCWLEGEDVLLWEFRTRWNNIPASYSKSIVEIVPRLMVLQSDLRKQFAELEQPQCEWFPWGERQLVQRSPCIRFCVSLQIPTSSKIHHKKNQKTVNSTELKKLKWKSFLFKASIRAVPNDTHTAAAHKCVPHTICNTVISTRTPCWVLQLLC